MRALREDLESDEPRIRARAKKALQALEKPLLRALEDAGEWLLARLAWQHIIEPIYDERAVRALVVAEDAQVRDTAFKP